MKNVKNDKIITTMFVDLFIEHYYYTVYIYIYKNHIFDTIFFYRKIY